MSAKPILGAGVIGGEFYEHLTLFDRVACGWVITAAHAPKFVKVSDSEPQRAPRGLVPASKAGSSPLLPVVGLR